MLLDVYKIFMVELLITKPDPNMLKILPIIPSSTTKKLPIILILFSYHYLLFPYYFFTLMFQVHIDIKRKKKLICSYQLYCRYSYCANCSDTSKMVNESHPRLFLN